MKQLDWYLGKTALAGTLLVLLILLSLFLFFSFVEQLDDIGKGQYDFQIALQYVLLQTPRTLYELFPVAALLGTLLGLGGLANNSELIVMRAAGMSIARILRAVLFYTLPLIALMMLLGEKIAPHTEQWALNLQAQAKSGQITHHSRHGFWVREANSFINIREIQAGGRAGDIRVYTFDEQRRLRSMTHAAQARYTQDSWILEDLRLTRFADGRSVTEHIPRMNWHSLLSPDLLAILLLKPERLSAWELYKYVGYLSDNGQRAQPYELAMWNKLLYPLVIAAMMTLAAPFVFGSRRNMSGGRRVLIGALLGVVFYLLNQAIGHVSLLYGLNPFISALLPSLMIFLLAHGLMRKVS